ncbi:MAG: hypothetical protein M3541_15350 [Acidobacteriota bacterium]|nr:hypothetical protein [Acidobacteriota bacterium]MDQ3420126.1 hypothetical protein [Acidobacteriota bacterium]
MIFSIPLLFVFPKKGDLAFADKLRRMRIRCDAAGIPTPVRLCAVQA